MSLTWYSYPSLLRKTSTAALDCLDSMLCVGATFSWTSQVVYTPASGSNPASVSIAPIDILYKLLPLALSNGVPIRGDSCNSRTGAFNNTSTYGTGEYYVGFHTNDYVPYKNLHVRNYLYRNRRTSVCQYRAAVSIGGNSGRLSFDFDQMTGTFDARIDAGMWENFIDDTTTDTYAPSQYFPGDYPNQSVDLTKLQSGAGLGFVFNFTIPGDKSKQQVINIATAFDLLDESGNSKYWTDNPIENYFFKLPFSRS